MLRRILPTVLGLTLLVPLPGATWSIVCVNLETREVAVASATCLENFNLRIGVPVLVVGEGAAAAQSFVDQTGDNRRLLYFSFRDDERTPAELLQQLSEQDFGHQTRQYGIVNFSGDPVTFTGTQDGLAATGVTGRVGPILYAIQGNVLAGDAVVQVCEQTFLATKGDMSQKIMAAMEAARLMGGDGRCSCSNREPTGCGAPPPDFDKSAHVAVFVQARMGDSNGGCNANRGCAQGDYYLALNVIDGAGDPDPVETLHSRYKIWREHLRGRPDGILSRLRGVKGLPADGETVRTITVELRDIEDRPLGHGGAVVEVRTADGLPPLSQVGPVRDLGDGRYTFELRAGTREGLDRFVITASDAPAAEPDDLVRATLFPYLEIETLDTSLHLGVDSISASEGGELPFVVRLPEQADRPFWLVARLAGTGAAAGLSGGLRAGGGTLLPLPQSPFFPGRPGLLDGRGRAEARLDVPPGALRALVGSRIECSAVVLDPRPQAVGARAAFSVEP